MIRLTRLNETEIVVNAEQIKYVESAPDTIITLTNNEKLIVRDSVEDVIQKVIEFKRISFPLVLTEQKPGSSE